jgi:DNA (cytosine-5)-methyltransferase 1
MIDGGGAGILTHVSLFTGIGGLDLAAEAAGFETVLQVEREPYALRILEKHWPDVPRVTDVRDVTRSSIDEPVTVVSGGFPCQPFSAAGKRRGADDDRYLWPEFLRIAREIQPEWIVAENVPGLLSLGDGEEIDAIMRGLDDADYEGWIHHHSAAIVGAIHLRERVFIVAYNRSKRGEGHQQAGSVSEAGQGGACRSEDMQSFINSPYSDGARWPKPLLRRGYDDVPYWVDRLTTLGNAVVPAQAYPIFAAIAHTEVTG